MQKIIEKILQEKGTQLLSEPAALRQEMLSKGCGPEEALKTELILTACPTVAGMLSRSTEDPVTPEEASMLITAAVRKTGLNPSEVRHIVGSLFRACHFDLRFWGTEHLFLNFAKPGRHDEFFAEWESEDQICEQAGKNLLSDDEKDRKKALEQLKVLSGMGNGKASYLLGMNFFRETDKLSRNSTEGKSYFLLAERQGFAPANAALAWYETRERSMTKAASRFRYPTALSGSYGREWAFVNDGLTSYRDQNMKNYRTASVWTIIVFLLSLAAAILDGDFSFLPVMSLILQAVGVLWTFIGRIRFRFVPVGWVYCGMLLCFFLQALHII